MESSNAPKQRQSLRAHEDLKLVQQAVNGDERVFTLLFDRYRSPISQFIGHRTHNGSDAQDLTMETFGKVFLKLGTFNPSYAFSTWVYKIASNNCVDFARRRRPANKHLTDYDATALSNLSDGMLNPEEEVIRNERIAMVSKLLQRLTPRFRKMIELRFYEEMTYEEISEQLQVPIGTVKAQLFRAKEMMRQLVETSKLRA
jgi:RNA polymerase sigma-70 factor (ECF subfamily)